MKLASADQLSFCALLPGHDVRLLISNASEQTTPQPFAGEGSISDGREEIADPLVGLAVALCRSTRPRPARIPTVPWTTRTMD